VDPSLFVIGTRSRDTLHIDGSTWQVQGGAGYYTALAAAGEGVSTVLFGPRAMPSFEHRDHPLLNFRGPIVSEDQLPRLEIAPDELPDSLAEYGIVHIAALSSAGRQREFLRACRERGAKRVSAGTYARIARSEREVVREVFNESDLWFMNEGEAQLLFGEISLIRARTGKVVFVTRAAAGAVMITDRGVREFPAPIVEEIDPTGAGDTFCGVTLAQLLRGAPPSDAAAKGVRVASAMITGIGPSVLLERKAPT
jgi:sugar/nucleoside kinase (ribokinase family)